VGHFKRPLTSASPRTAPSTVTALVPSCVPRVHSSLHVNKRQSHTTKDGCNYLYTYFITKKVKLTWTQYLIRCIGGTTIPDIPDLCTRWNLTVNCTPPTWFSTEENIIWPHLLHRDWNILEKQNINASIIFIVAPCINASVWNRTDIPQLSSPQSVHYTDPAISFRPHFCSLVQNNGYGNRNQSGIAELYEDL